MNMTLSGKLRRKVEQFQKRFASKGLILMYHRVAEVEIDPWGLCVTPQHFAQQLEVLQKSYQPLSLKQLLQSHQDGNIPHQSVAITFDDGYADNLYHAKSLLEQYGLPTTVFVSTGHVGREREFWWDELERLLLQPGKLPEQLLLPINSSMQHWELGRASDYSQEEYQRDRTSRAWKAQPGSRMSFYYSMWQRLRPLPEAERQQVLDEILAWTITEPKPRSTHRSLSPEELSTLAQGELVEIGAHTVTHPFLSAQSTVLQRDEIQQSKTDLEAVINRPVTSFSYPFGDRTAETVELAKASGFDCACSTVQDLVWQQSDRFDLPRFGVENWNGEEFAKQLLRWFHG